jgi:hypothetical protein
MRPPVTKRKPRIEDMDEDLRTAIALSSSLSEVSNPK